MESLVPNFGNESYTDQQIGGHCIVQKKSFPLIRVGSVGNYLMLHGDKAQHF